MKPRVQGARLVSWACAAACLLSFGAGAAAQTQGDIVRALAPKKALTRSLRPEPELSVEDRDFLRRLPTRSIHFDPNPKTADREPPKLSDGDRTKLSDIVKSDALPKIDLTITFDYNSDAIATASVPTVIELGKALTNPSLASARILLNGHTDAAGNDRYNLALSERRAQSVKTYLVSHFGIHDERLFAVGYGREQLKNKAEPLAAENRRVEIVNLGTN